MATNRDRLRSFLKRARKTQRDFARACGVTPSMLSKMLTGDRTPSLAVATKIEKSTAGRVKATGWSKG